MREIFPGPWPWMLAMLLFIVFLTKLSRNKKVEKRKYRLPPGRTGWPLVGDSFNWYDADCCRFGKIFSCSLFGKWAVVSADPSFNRFVMQNEGKLFQSSYPKSFRDLVGKNGVITVQGDQQRKLHAIASNMMRLDKLIKFHILEDIQMVMLQTLANFHNNQHISLQDVCRKASHQIIIKPQAAINQMVNQLLGVTSDSEAREKIIGKINNIIEMHRQMQLQGTGATQQGGIGVLGRLVEEESLPDEAVADFIINLLFAGNETTAKTMLFAVYFLTHCPKAMKQLMDEQDGLRRNSNGEELLTWQDYKAMPFTQCVIDETLRLGGIAIWLMREAKEDVNYQDYIIPKGCFIVPFLSAVHLDENVYEGALTFNPWRWMDPQNEEKRNWRSSPFYAPFGGGARFCPGAELARLQIALFLHYFVTTYRWTQLKEDQLSFFPSARLVNGFQIRLTKRHDEMQELT
ncbi:abietadienol/abietadienal oxidase [Quercus suber]|uniref:Abietadienol/abietadienal oxidase n=1 Tax=Quercus suber TaxID=58331 RepID=A0AAW0LNY8_QUESU